MKIVKNKASKAVMPANARIIGKGKSTKVESPVKVTGKAVALITGKRGVLSRLVETGERGSEKFIRATQDNAGLSIVGGWCLIDGGMITAKTERKTRVELGGYVNGRNTGAKVQLTTQAAYERAAKPFSVKWNVDKEAVKASVIGDTAKRGIVAVLTAYKGKPFFWQCELDSNAHNLHERGTPSKAAK